MILTCHVIGYKVQDHLEPRLVGTGYEGFKLLHSLGHLDSEIGVDVVIVLDSIGTSGLALHHYRVVFCNAVSGIVRLRGVLEKPSEPNVCVAVVLDAFEDLISEAIHLCAAVLLNSTVYDVVETWVAVKTSEDLVYSHTLHGSSSYRNVSITAGNFANHALKSFSRTALVELSGAGGNHLVHFFGPAH